MKATLFIGQAVGMIPSWQRGREALRTPLYANSAYLMADAVAGAALGFVFWTVVARVYPTEAVGLGAALLSAVGLLTYLASLGLGTGLVRFLPSAGAGASDLLNSCFTLTGLAAVVLAVVFLAGLPFWSPALLPVRQNAIFAAAFVAFAAAGTLYGLLSQVFVALRRAEFVLITDVLHALLKVGIVFALASAFSLFGIFASWGLAAACVLALGSMVFLRRLVPGYRPLPSLRRQVSNDMVSFSIANYLSTGLWSVPGWLLPLVVVNTMGGAANAYFFISWGLAALLFAIPGAVATSLFAQGSHQEEHLARDVRRSLTLISALLLPAMALMLVAGDKLLLLFGKGYSAEGTKVLWALVPSALPVAVNVVYLGIARVQKRLKDVILLAGGVALGTVVLGYLLIPPLGLLGPAVGWLVSQGLVALAVLPCLVKALRSEPATAAGAAAQG